MAIIRPAHALSTWSPTQKFLLRFSTLFFALLIIPLDWHFWLSLFSTHRVLLQRLLYLSAYTPNFLVTSRWGLASYSNWALIALIALLGALIWQTVQKPSIASDDLYYWLRVVLRYRLAIGLLVFGILKFIPLQFPRPTLSDLNTDYGDFLIWKIYYLSNGAAGAGYREALGIVEIAAGIFLFWKRTATIGGLIAAFILTNIVLANFAYELGDHVYATELLLLAIFILLYDAGRLWSLLVREQPTLSESFVSPQINVPRAVHVYSRVAVTAFLLVFSVSAFIHFRHSDWPLPATPGLPNISGLYDVSQFSVNGQAVPYSPTDPARWQNVVFEQWNTLSIRIHRPVTLVTANPELDGDIYSIFPSYEYAGNGGRHFYSYAADKEKQVLHLAGLNDPGENLDLHYDLRSDGSIELEGKDVGGNNLQVVLSPTHKDYLLLKGRRKPIKLY